MATACWAFIVAKSTPVETASLLGFCGVARLQHGNSSTSYAQVGAHRLWTSWRPAEVPGDTAPTQRFQPRLYRSEALGRAQILAKWAQANLRHKRPQSGSAGCLCVWRTWLLPDGKTRRPTRLSGHRGRIERGTCNHSFESEPAWSATCRWMVRLAGIEPATLSLGGRCSIH